MHRPSEFGAFEFVILSSLRAAQLMRGCRPRIEGFHKNTVIAQLEIAQGKVSAQTADDPGTVPDADAAAKVDEAVPALVAG